MFTGTVMLVLLMVLAIAAAVAAIAVAVAAVASLRRLRARTAAPTGPAGAAPADPFRDTDTDALRGDPRRIAVGDIVDVRGQPFAVRGSVRFVEGSWSWSEHLLDDARGRRRWLSVEEDPDLELVLWTSVESATVTPGPPTVEFSGRRYTSVESGRARFTATGTTGLDPNGTVHYHDYRAPDGARLSFERYGDAPATGRAAPGGAAGAGSGAAGSGAAGSAAWEVATGEPLHRAEVQIYPAAG